MQSLDKQYASFSKKLDVFSNLCKYLTIESIIEKYTGKRLVSNRTTYQQYYFYIFLQI